LVAEAVGAPASGRQRQLGLVRRNWPRLSPAAAPPLCTLSTKLQMKRHLRGYLVSSWQNLFDEPMAKTIGHVTAVLKSGAMLPIPEKKDQLCAGVLSGAKRRSHLVRTRISPWLVQKQAKLTL
jgi:hypothetical protein